MIKNITMESIPKARGSVKYPFDTLKKGKFFVSGEFTRAHQEYFGSIVVYYNRTRKPKRFVQRRVKNENRIYREL